MKAIKITPENLRRIEAETGVRPESLELLAKTRDNYLVFGSDVISGLQTYHETILRSTYRFVNGERVSQFADVEFI